MSKPILSNHLVKKLIDAGLVPSNCTRIIIDLPRWRGGQDLLPNAAG